MPAMGQVNWMQQLESLHDATAEPVQQKKKKKAAIIIIIYSIIV